MLLVDGGSLIPSHDKNSDQEHGDGYAWSSLIKKYLAHKGFYHVQ